MVTEKGVIKKTSLELFSRPRKGGIIALSLDSGDELISVRKTDGERNLIIATRNGIAVRFSEKALRPMGRTARGVRGIRLKHEDKVVEMVVGREDRTLLTVTEKGYGKRTPIGDYRLINRGGSGVINIKCTEKNGKVVAVKSVTDEDELMLISKKGIGIRVNAKDVSKIGRATQGVRIMRLEPGDNVVAAARIVKD
jgi:DNA gyrase subunit A